MANEHLKEWKDIRARLEKEPLSANLKEQWKTTRLNSLDRLIQSEEQNA